MGIKGEDTDRAPGTHPAHSKCSVSVSDLHSFFAAAVGPQQQSSLWVLGSISALPFASCAE